MPHREALIEFIRVGAYVKVSAVDPETLIEVSIVGQPSRGEAALKELAVKKLEYVLRKKGLRPSINDAGSAPGTV
ncbi:DUF6898 family protein [Fodinicurvata sediminis]|uniref:DUF6898 family protein n=1 Tax=Fodinicurvata sediminis TaxID=1121832 RepID=UPI0003F63F12